MITISIQKQCATAAEALAFLQRLDDYTVGDLNPVSEGTVGRTVAITEVAAAAAIPVEQRQLTPTDPAVSGSPVPAPETGTKPKRGRPRKSETAQPAVAHVTPAAEAAQLLPGSDAGALRASDSAVDPAAAEQRKTEPSQEGSGSAAAGANVTIDDVREAMAGLSGRKGIDACRAALTAYGASRISDLKPEQYAAFIAEVSAS